MFGYIYVVVNLSNNKKYIGRHKSNNFDSSYFGSGKIMKNALQKYGKNNFEVRVLEWCEDADSLYKREKFWIDYYDAVKGDDYYNLAEGGSGPLLVPENTKEKLRVTFTGDNNPAKRPEVRKKISDGKLGSKNPMFGYMYSDEQKRRMSERSSGSKNGFYGHKHSDETKEKIRNAKTGKESKRKRMVTIDGIQYDSVSDAMESLHISTRRLYKILKDGENNV